MSGDLSEFVKKNSKFLTIEDGDTFTGKYTGFLIVPNQFDPEKESVQYKLEYEDGIKVTWNNGSTRVASMMSKFSAGETVTIKRTGSGTKDTKYTITLGDS